jgi:VIT1/CCC1 family predicted Fe2+/Mn2+ transporter
LPTVARAASVHHGGVHLSLRPSRLTSNSLAAGSIRELVFGVEDGVVQNMTLVAGMVGAQLSRNVIVLAASVNAIAGVLSMSMGTYLSSKAELDVAAAAATAPPGEHNPKRDAVVMAAAYAIGALVPLLPFIAGLGGGGFALLTAMLLTGATLFGLGVVKAVLSRQSRFRSGIEMLLLASAAGLAGYLIGVAAESVFRIE